VVGLPDLHFHDLRHIGNTMAAAQGVSLKELMEQMGHSSPRAALIYLHATRERDKKIAAGMGYPCSLAPAPIRWCWCQALMSARCAFD
jgi:integrase